MHTEDVLVQLVLSRILPARDDRERVHRELEEVHHLWLLVWGDVRNLFPVYLIWECLSSANPRLNVFNVGDIDLGVFVQWNKPGSRNGEKEYVDDSIDEEQCRNDPAQRNNPRVVLHLTRHPDTHETRTAEATTSNDGYRQFDNDSNKEHFVKVNGHSSKRFVKVSVLPKGENPGDDSPDGREDDAQEAVQPTPSFEYGKSDRCSENIDDQDKEHVEAVDEVQARQTLGLERKVLGDVVPENRLAARPVLDGGFILAVVFVTSLLVNNRLSFT